MPFQLDFASIWYDWEDYGTMRAKHLAQAAMKVQVDRLRAEASEDDSHAVGRGCVKGRL